MGAYGINKNRVYMRTILNLRLERRGHTGSGDTRDRYSVTHLSIRQLNKEYNRYK